MRNPALIMIKHNNSKYKTHSAFQAQDTQDFFQESSAFSKDAFKKYVKAIMTAGFRGCSCSCVCNKSSDCVCNNTKVRRHAYYKYTKRITMPDGTEKISRQDRTFTDLDRDGKPVRVFIRIPVVRCSLSSKVSEKTRVRAEIQKFHAFSPDDVPKRGRHTYFFIFTVLKEYSVLMNTPRDERPCKVTDLAGKYGIDISTLYRWIGRFMEQFRAFANLYAPSENNRKMAGRISEEMIRQATGAFRHSFYHTFAGITFMEGSAWQRNYRQAPDTNPSGPMDACPA